MTEDLDQEGTVLRYVRLAGILRDQIVSGELRPDQALPGERAMAARYKVSAETVRRAVRMLREEGLLITRRGIGTLVTAGAPPRQRVTAGPGDVITARMPAPAERARHDIPDGVPVLVLRRPGRDEHLYNAGTTQIIVEG